jgi:hypothetical protein
VFDKPHDVFEPKSVRNGQPERKLEVEVRDSNGRVDRIFEWTNGVRLDKRQKRSFESILSLVTFA